MALWLLAGLAAFVLLWLLLRWLAQVPAADLARAVRTFVAVFGALLAAGFSYAGRVGLAAAALAAAAVALRALWKSRSGADPLEDDGEDAGRSDDVSRVETASLVMELDRRSGRLDGTVKAGPLAGRRLSALPVEALLDLLAELRRNDPESANLLEAYLDRREPAWRTRAHERGRAAGPSAEMDEATAWAVLGLEPGADEEAIRAAHRRLMSRLHPDHGGSEFLARQLNQARDVLLKRAKGRAR